MNGNARIFWRTGRLALLSGATAVLAGCASLPGMAGDALPGPPAGQTGAEILETGPAPVLADIPPSPTDVRAPAAWRSAIEDQQSEGVFVVRSAAAETWTLTGSEAFAAQARAEANAAGLHPPTDAEIAESEAFVRAMRKRAIPPSSPR